MMNDEQPKPLAYVVQIKARHVKESVVPQVFIHLWGFVSLQRSNVELHRVDANNSVLTLSSCSLNAV